ncbi:MAG: prepilin-type N-terminal cleavage/methylation domain-containing protein, partial [Acinetobacter sp.]|nr:prepilin-type N-terminal cleavage/methylation domain-containing protein [Acinetobacter sp.]
MQNKHKGFTLIELMVTIAVMAIIAMMAAPS